MKQHITPEDWGTFERSNPEAAKKAREYYSNWQQEYIQERYPNQFVTMDWWPINIFFNIGQMIEFLHDHKIHYLTALECEWPNYDCDYDKFFKAQDICDALWGSVKEVFNK